MPDNYFTILNGVDCKDKIEKKNGLSYLSWAWAWSELKKRYPESTYTIYENADGLNYHTDGRTAWVKTGVTVKSGDKSIEHIEYLPVMDFKNKSIPLENLTSFDVNKAIQRSLTKAVARHGLGLYIYAGEDLPEDESKAKTASKAASTKASGTATAAAHSSIRGELVETCNTYSIDITKICKDYHLNNNSPDADFKKALDFCRYLIDSGDYGNYAKIVEV